MNAPNKSGWKPEMTIDTDGFHGGPATTTGNHQILNRSWAEVRRATSKQEVFSGKHYGV